MLGSLTFLAWTAALHGQSFVRHEGIDNVKLDCRQDSYLAPVGWKANDQYVWNDPSQNKPFVLIYQHTITSPDGGSLAMWQGGLSENWSVASLGGERSTGLEPLETGSEMMIAVFHRNNPDAEDIKVLRRQDTPIKPSLSLDKFPHAKVAAYSSSILFQFTLRGRELTQAESVVYERQLFTQSNVYRAGTWQFRRVSMVRSPREKLGITAAVLQKAVQSETVDQHWMAGYKKVYLEDLTAVMAKVEGNMVASAITTRRARELTNENLEREAYDRQNLGNQMIRFLGGDAPILVPPSHNH